MGFILSKIAWMFIAPGNLLLLLLLLSGFLAMARHEGWQSLGRRLCFDLAFILFFIAIFPVGEWLLLPLENRFVPARPTSVDGIIIIGSNESPAITEVRGQPTPHSAAANYLVFATLAKQYPKAKLVYAGGSSSLTQREGAKLTDADIARQVLAVYGVDVDNMMFESKSRTTHENAELAAALVHPQPQEKWLLVTSAFHMPRSIGAFRKAGWNVLPAPADYRTDGKLDSELSFDFSGHLGMMTMAMHEYYGLVSYWLMGYTDSVWPKP